MEIKDRVIRTGKINDNTAQINCIIMDEIGIKDGEILQRNITINENVYAEFEKSPDQEMYLDVYLNQHYINSEWIGYPNNVLPKNETYKNMYDDLSKRESLIENPLIIDVFNEAIKDDSELSSWESVYPFFR